MIQYVAAKLWGFVDNKRNFLDFVIEIYIGFKTIHLMKRHVY